MEFVFGLPFMFAGTILLGALLLFISAQVARRQRETIRALAPRLGLSYYDGSAELAAGRVPETPTGAPGPNAEQLQNLRKLQSSGLGAGVLRLLSSMAPWQMRGRIDGVEVLARQESRGSGKSRQIYTVLEARFERPLGLGLALSHQDFFDTIGVKVFGGQDIEVGKKEFDDQVRIKGQSESAVKSLLASPAAQQAILAGIGKHPSLNINDERAMLDFRGFVKEEEKYREGFSALTRVVQALQPGRGF